MTTPSKNNPINIKISWNGHNVPNRSIRAREACAIRSASHALGCPNTSLQLLPAEHYLRKNGEENGSSEVSHRPRWSSMDRRSVHRSPLRVRRRSVAHQRKCRAIFLRCAVYARVLIAINSSATSARGKSKPARSHRRPCAFGIIDIRLFGIDFPRPTWHRFRHSRDK
jgi:hypothetical protein